MESPEHIRIKTLESVNELLKYTEVDNEISSTFYGSAADRMTLEYLEKIVVNKPDSTFGTSLARTISAIGKGYIYPGKVLLYKSYFRDFNVHIGTEHTAADLGLSIEQRRILVMLHELTHVTRRYVDALQFLGMHYFDEAIYDKSTINERIYRACVKSKDPVFHKKLF